MLNMSAMYATLSGMQDAETDITAMAWLADQLLKSPGYWYFEDLSIRLLQIGMLTQNANHLAEGPLTYVVDLELLEG
ncbi:hypothetical protein D918_03743 [Trichuris suis]|nr:hypothetical protein D918_03743 [Trichuris suis]